MTSTPSTRGQLDVAVGIYRRSLIDFTGVTAVPQIFLQSYAYASAAVPLTPAGERLVIASISFSLLSLLRSICGLLASWRKIRFTFQRVNGNLETEVFNACLHECADAAGPLGHRCSFKFKAEGEDDDRDDVAHVAT